MKRSLWMMILFFLMGILCAQCLGGDFFDAYGYLSDYQLQSFAADTLDRMDLGLNILWMRFKWLMVFALVCSTSAKRMIPIVGKVFVGFFAGFFAAACVIQMGGYGILFFLICIFPHSFCYLMAYMGIYHFQPTYTSDGKRKNLKSFLLIARVILFGLLGCACETWAGTHLLQLLLAWVYQ